MDDKGPRYIQNFNKLKAIFNQRPVVLFLGAGVNAPYAPLWPELTSKLLKKALSNLSEVSEKARISDIEKFLKHSSDYYKATIIKELLGDQYLIQLAYLLYSNLEYSRERFTDTYSSWRSKNGQYEFPYGGDLSHINSPTTLFAVADLCCNRNVHAVVTYNYDEYLSVLINHRGERKAEDVFQSKQVNSMDNDQLLIYHVHGFIPSNEGFINERPQNIVLAYDEYFQNMMEPYSWQTITQLYFLMNYTCVFIGTSLNDWNMLRILSNARQYSNCVEHFVFYANGGNQISKNSLSRLKATALNNSGINILNVGDNYSNIISNLKKLNTPN